MSAVLARDSSLPIRRLCRVLGAVALACALLFGYGALTELAWRVRLRLEGEQAAATVVAHETSAGGIRPMVALRAHGSEQWRALSSDAFTAWTAPPIGTAVDVSFWPDQPTVAHLHVRNGLAAYEWLVVPAALAFLLLMCLLSGVRLLLV